MPTVAHCCCSGGVGTALYVYPRFCGTYSGSGVTIRFEGPGVDETRSLGSYPMSSVAVYSAPPSGTWTITVAGPCLRTTSTTISVLAGSAAYVYIDAEPDFLNTLTWSDDFGSCSITKTGASCVWMGSYSYTASDAIDWDGSQWCYPIAATIPVYVRLVLTGVAAGSASFRAERLVSVWQSGSCGGPSTLQTRPSPETCRGPLSDVAYVYGQLTGSIACGSALSLSGSIGSLLNSPWLGFVQPSGCRVVSTTYAKQAGVFTPTVTIS